MSAFTSAGLFLGLALTVVYVARMRAGARLDGAIRLLVGATGLAGAIKLAVVCLTAQTLGPFGAEDRLYIFAGGFALGWVSTQSILDVLGGLAARRAR